MSMEDGVDDKFPAGLRVLVVDDDPTCLKVLDTLLSKCQYNVTTTNQSKVALQLLRENKDKFDLVISDVYMPDMDGFKLLELIGLEMDLPVIMLSANGDTNLVMKGVKHGAVDYLIKPVRLQELKNIWQHVLRKNKTIDHQGNAAEGCGSDDVPGGLASHSKPDQDNRKRKDQSGDDGHGDEDDEHVGENGTRESRDGDTAGTQKRPRVIWSVDLHRKFVSAVDELGIERAFPKKILEIMNVDGLTRENVASHLQKYRLYLKRISESQRQTNSPPVTDSTSIFQNGLLGRGLAAPGYFAGSSSFQSPGMLNRFNPSTGLNNSPSPIIQTPNNALNLNNSRNTLARYQQLGLASNLSQNPNPSLLQGNSTLSSQIQLNRNSIVLPGQNNLLQTTGNVGGFNDQSSTFNARTPSNMHQILGGMIGGNNSNLMYSSNNRSLNNGVAAAVQSPVQPTPLQNDQLAPNHNQLMNNNQNPSVAAAAARIRKDLEYVLNGGLTPLDNSGGNMQMQTPMLVPGQEGLNGLQNTVGTTSSNNVLNGHQDTIGTHSSNNVMCNNYGLNTMVPTPNQNQNQGFPVAQNGTLYSGNFNCLSSSAVANTITSTPLLQRNEIQITGSNARTGLEDDYLLEDFAANNGGSLEDIMNEILTQGTGGPTTDGALSGLHDELFRAHM